MPTDVKMNLYTFSQSKITLIIITEKVDILWRSFNIFRGTFNWYYVASKIPDLNEKQLYNLYTYLCINAEELEKIGVETQNACRRA